MFFGVRDKCLNSTKRTVKELLELNLDFFISGDLQELEIFIGLHRKCFRRHHDDIRDQL